MDFFKLLRISEQNYYCAIVGSETIERKRQECNMDRTSLQKGGLYRYTDLCMHIVLIIRPTMQPTSPSLWMRRAPICGRQKNIVRCWF